MTIKQRLALWVIVFGFGLYNLEHMDLLTALVLWGLGVCAEMQSERADRERNGREMAQDWSRHYAELAYGEKRGPAKVLKMSDYNGDEAA